MPDPSTVPTEQPGNGTPAPAQQAPVQYTEPTPAQPPAASPSSEEIATLRQQAEQARAYQEQLAQVQEQYKFLQGDYTRKSQALAQLSGAQTPPQAQQDPLTPYIEGLSRKGYDKQQARDLAEMVHGMVAPLQQQLQQAAQIGQNQALVDSVMRDAWSQAPTVLGDPRISAAVENQLRAAAAQGMVIDRNMALSLGFVEQGWASLKPNQQQPAPQAQPLPHNPQPVPQYMAHGMYRPATGYPPPQPTVNAQTPEQQEAQRVINETFKLNKSA